MTLRLRPIRGVSLGLCIAGTVTIAAHAAPERVAPAAHAEPETASATQAPSRATTSVVGIALGTPSTDDDGRLASVRDAFAPDDAIAVSIETATTDDVAVRGMLEVLWTYAHGDETVVVSRTRQALEFQGPGSTRFEIAKPDGFPPGDYRVDVWLDGVQVGSRGFAVRE